MLIRLLTALTLMTGTAQAQAARTPSHCIALAGDIEGAAFVQAASYDVDVPSETVLIHYIDHASFLIRSHGGLNIVTDFTGYIGNVPMIPDVVTMNHAHDTHWTAFPDPAISHALNGWGHSGRESTITSIWARFWCAMSRQTSAANMVAARPRGTRSLSLKWQACASAILGICTTNRTPGNMRPSGGWTS